MREMGTIESPNGAVLTRARGRSATQVLQIAHQTGVFSGVEPEALRPAFDATVKGTPAAGTNLGNETVPDRGCCPRQDTMSSRTSSPRAAMRRPSGDPAMGRGPEPSPSDDVMSAAAQNA
jgi:Zn finger protein HypA/HybF involved in hydrogenase expression